MAEAFPLNHDDGELWLPSDLYPDVEVHRSPELAYVEDLVQQLAAFGLLDRALLAPTMSPRRNPEGFRPAARFGPGGREVETRFVYNGFRAPVTPSSGFGFGLRRDYPLRSGRPVLDDVGSGGDEKQALKNTGKKGMSCHSPTEIALPQDWTY
ncbi:hypothetical protein J5N97_012150 [Dioscorea zingiberensis]|uniref:Uncharacterized protein n=1 Tax=Dioscorea zingiberensis TaxID=325984 RepID=A0A9D5CNL5_9LILI|nr:hypothetical protein J5N97_012150 [Dioscorea zingiberensis]